MFGDEALTNERGVDGTIRLLKNVMGLWLEQECARVWQVDYPTLHAEAASAAQHVEFDVDDERFLRGGNMPALIQQLTGILSRGELVITEREYTGHAGHGTYTPRSTCQYLN